MLEGPHRAYEQSSSKPSLPIIGLVIILVLAVGAWWFLTPKEPTPSPVSTPIPLAVTAVPSPTPAAVSGLAQTFTIGTATLTVQQTSKPTKEGRVETLSFSSDQETTVQVLYVVPKETYASATQLKQENLDFADAIVLEEDPVLVVPLVLKPGEVKKQSMNVKHKQDVAFYKLVFPDELMAKNEAERDLLTLKDLQDIANHLGRTAFLRTPSELANLEKQLADNSILPAQRVTLLKAFLDKSKQEELQRVEFLFSYLNPAAAYNLTLIGSGDALFKIEDSVLALDSAGLKDALPEAFSFKKIHSYQKDGLDYSNYLLVFDFRKYISRNGRLPFSGSVQIDLKYGFASAGEQTFSIPITLTNTDTNRKALADYVVNAKTYFFPDANQQFLSVLNNLPYELSVNLPCVSGTLPSQWSAPSRSELGIGNVPCGTEADSSIRLQTQTLPQGLNERTVAPLRASEPLNHKTAPYYLIDCKDAQDVAESLFDDLFKEIQSSSSDVYSVVSPPIPSTLRAATIIHFAEKDAGDTCPVSLDRYNADAPSAELTNGYSYIIRISTDLTKPEDGVKLSAEQISKRWEYYVNAGDGSETPFSDDKEQFFSVAEAMTDALNPPSEQEIAQDKDVTA